MNHSSGLFYTNTRVCKRTHKTTTMAPNNNKKVLNHLGAAYKQIRLDMMDDFVDFITSSEVEMSEKYQTKLVEVALAFKNNVDRVFHLILFSVSQTITMYGMKSLKNNTEKTPITLTKHGIWTDC
jgi:hypothetical protein